MPQEKTGSGFLFIANDACIDFINTVYIINGEQMDMLQDFPALVDWLEDAGLIDSDQRQKALQSWRNTTYGDLAVEKAKEFRAVIRTLVERSAEVMLIPSDVLAEINTYLRLGRVYTKIQKTTDGKYILQSCRELNNPLQLLVPIAESIADLLASSHLSNVKKCENPNCILHFYDKSKNHSRRWCSMEACGNRMKAVAHYRRNRHGDK